ncbi:MAG: hypothetical protein R3B45_06035 [Bdellovibrionota bacterium]
MRSLANIALHRVEIIDQSEIFLKEQVRVVPTRLKGFEGQYGLSSVSLFDQNGTRVWNSARGYGSEVPERTSNFVIETFERFRAEKTLVERSAVVTEEAQDVVKGIAPIVDPVTGDLLGAILTEEKFQAQILKSVEKFWRIFQRFGLVHS